MGFQIEKRSHKINMSRMTKAISARPVATARWSSSWKTAHRANAAIIGNGANIDIAEEGSTYNAVIYCFNTLARNDSQRDNSKKHPVEVSSL